MSKLSFQLMYDPLSIVSVQDFLGDNALGAQVIFVGTVRNQSKEKNVLALEFEAYETMVIKELDNIAFEIDERWRVDKIALHHALGRKAVSEPAVIAGIGAKHRKEAFEACEYLMNRLKQSVPIWKKEIFEDGAEWVSQTP